MRLFHFSDDGTIGRFKPRPVRVPSARPTGQDWLNGPLVWAIDEPHQPMYLFPRDCPRILLWQTPQTLEADRAAWWGERTDRMIACVGRRLIARSRLYFRVQGDGEPPPRPFDACCGDGP